MIHKLEVIKEAVKTAEAIKADGFEIEYDNSEYRRIIFLWEKKK